MWLSTTRGVVVVVHLNILLPEFQPPVEVIYKHSLFIGLLVLTATIIMLLLILCWRVSLSVRGPGAEEQATGFYYTAPIKLSPAPTTARER